MLIIWYLAGNEHIVKYGDGVQQAFATLDMDQRHAITVRGEGVETYGPAEKLELRNRVRTKLGRQCAVKIVGGEVHAFGIPPNVSDPRAEACYHFVGCVWDFRKGQS